LPFLLAAGVLSVWAMADSGWTDARPYVVFVVVFLVQVARPTLLGWAVSFLGWFWFGFFDCLYMRFALHRAEYTLIFIFWWGLFPLILMYLIRPRRNKGRVGRAETCG
jgi:hypothetical protein